MARQIITVIVSIILIVGFSWLEKVLKSAKRSTVSRSAANRPNTTARPPRQHIYMPPAPVQTPTAPDEPIVEGERVTDDTQPIELQLEQNAEIVSRNELRRLIIWSEILRPKFNRE